MALFFSSEVICDSTARGTGAIGGGFPRIAIQTVHLDGILALPMTRLVAGAEVAGTNLFPSTAA
jgi:hypothetical protein